MEELKRLPDLWSYLKTITKPIVLYGMGDGADKIINICSQLDIPISGVFASDGFAKSKQFHHWTVESFSQISDRLGETIVLLAFGSAKPGIMADIAKVASQQELYIPDTPVAGEGWFDSAYLNANWKQIEEAYKLLADQPSRDCYRDILYYKLTGKKQYLDSHPITRREMFEELFSFKQGEVFVDAGAYRGDTVEEFIAMTGDSYRWIHAIEPDGKNYKKLRDNLESVPRISCLEAAAWKGEETLYFNQKSGRGGRLDTGMPNTRGVAIDDIVEGGFATYLKYDVEGAEKEAIEGSEKTIVNSYPKLLISAYHRRGDLFRLPLMLHKMAPEYSLYIRRNHGYPAWDINLICIKE